MFDESNVLKLEINTDLVIGDFCYQIKCKVL